MEAFVRQLKRAAVGVVCSSMMLGASLSARAQQAFFTREDVIKYTPDWQGERFPDGRPKVPDSILDRMKNVTLEEAWATLRTHNFNHEYEDGWLSIHPDKVLVGRALTATWVPGRPDIQKVIEAQGAADHRQGAENAWPVDMLQPRDVYVADHFGLKTDGPSIGDNVGNAIYARSGNGSFTTGQSAILTDWTSCRTLSLLFATTIHRITLGRWPAELVSTRPW